MDYIVLARGVMDDFPMLVTDSHKGAVEFAKNLTLEDVQKVATDVFRSDISELLCIHVVMMDSGRPIHTDVVVDFDTQ